MPSVRRPATLPLAFVLAVLPVAGVAATPGVAVGSPAAAALQDHDPSAIEASLALDRSTRRLIQHELRNEGFDPGTPDGLFGPRTRAAIREWQQSRGASPTGYLTSADLELLRAAPAPLPAVPQGWVASENRPAPTPTETGSNPPQPTVPTEEVNPQNAAETNTQQRTRAAASSGTVQLPPEILLDGHLLRAEDAVRERDPAAARAAMDRIVALQEQHELDSPPTYHYRYASVWNVLGAWDQSLASAVRYLELTGRDGEHYLDALTLMNRATAEIETIERARELRAAEEERARAEEARARAERG